MKQFLYTIEDTISNQHSQPFMGINDAQILRALKIMANHPENNDLKTDIHDKKVWRVGAMDIETGEITPEKKFIINAEELIMTTAEKEKSVLARMTTNEKIKYLEKQKESMEVKIQGFKDKINEKAQKEAENDKK